MSSGGWVDPVLYFLMMKGMSLMMMVVSLFSSEEGVTKHFRIVLGFEERQ